MMNEQISEYPISSYLRTICETIKKSESRFTVLTAETAAGKSTVLPLAVMECFDGKILMTEPRRLAVIGVADRVSELKGEKTGESVGYKIHLESKISDKTRFEVVTEAVLVKMLQSDPVLEGYNLIILDEFHERSVNLDLSLAFLKEAMELRDDLFVLIMSATINTGKIREYISSDIDKVPLIEVPGRQHKIDIVYDNKNSVEKIILNEIENCPSGNILVFFPGISEINKCKNNLLAVIDQSNIEVCVLHSSIKVEEQRRIISRETNVLEGASKRKIILSSAIGETSLTVPGVNCVIDTGYSRINRMNIASGMENLCTEKVCEFSAKQRSGRAGRESDGRCIRMWDKNDVLAKEIAPEILRADITSLVLECTERGILSCNGIDWIDSPQKNAWNASAELLKSLGFIKKDNHISEKGKIALKLGVHPRFAGIGIDSFDELKKELMPEGKELLLKFGSYSKSSPDIQKKFINDLERRLSKEDCGKFKKDEIVPLILSGFPDRLAKKSGETSSYIEFQFPSGRKARLYRDNVKHSGLEWIVAPELLAGDIEATIFEYEKVLENELEGFLCSNSERKTNCWFENGKISKSEDICFGQIVLSSKRVNVVPEDYSAAWISEIKKKGFNALPVDEKISSFLMRVEFWNQEYGLVYNKSDYKSVNEYLEEKAEEWLIPFINSTSKLSEKDVYDALYWFLKGNELDKVVPEKYELPNGKICKVKYEKIDEIKPVIEIIIQRVFGCFETPKICGKNVLLRLLSPASRPLQITDDLEGFWTGAWPEICKEMKGRYPKHNWNYTITDKSE